MSKIFKVNCPCCNEKILLKLEDGNLKVIQNEVSETELSEVIKELNIEFG